MWNQGKYMNKSWTEYDNSNHKSVCDTARRQDTNKPEYILGANLLFSIHNTSSPDVQTVMGSSFLV
jgi:hypothetical protein